MLDTWPTANLPYGHTGDLAPVDVSVRNDHQLIAFCQGLASRIMVFIKWESTSECSPLRFLALVQGFSDMG